MYNDKRSFSTLCHCSDVQCICDVTDCHSDQSTVHDYATKCEDSSSSNEYVYLNYECFEEENKKKGLLLFERDAKLNGSNWVSTGGGGEASDGPVLRSVREHAEHGPDCCCIGCSVDVCEGTSGQITDIVNESVFGAPVSDSSDPDCNSRTDSVDSGEVLQNTCSL